MLLLLESETDGVKRFTLLQRLAIEGFLKGSSVVVCAPTSSGKTLIAECAAAATLAMQRRLFYTTPLKALSNQKLREFRYYTWLISHVVAIFSFYL